jgi:sigma-B regulation protein RsbU (phosphoserine phosphatase)
MGFNLLFWIEGIIALFIGLLLFFDYTKHKESIYKYLVFIFLIIVLKSVLYSGIDFSGVLWIHDTIGTTGSQTDKVYEALQPLYNLKSFVWQAVELIFIIVLGFMFVIRRKAVETDNVKGLKVLMWVQLIVVILLTLPIVYFSFSSMEVAEVTTQKEGNKTFVVEELSEDGKPEIAPVVKIVDKAEIAKLIAKESVSINDEGFVRTKRTIKTYKSSVAAIETIKSYGKYLFLVWKIVLIIVAWLKISSIYGFIASLLSYISANKRLLFIFLGIEVLFYIFSGIVDFTVSPGWIGFEVIALLLLAVFGYKVHTHYIEDIEEEVESLEKERDIIIELMRDISGIIGSGDFELDVIIKEIVDSSVKGSSARAGTILLKDSLTNRLLVKYVNGLYPPTRPFKIVSGMTLNESVITEKLRAEKIAIGEGLIGEVAETGKSIYIPDILKDDRFVQTIKGTMDVVSFIAVPLKTRDEVFGVLSCVDDEKAFLESDLGLLETLGEQAAITIQQIQMYQEILEKKQAEKEIGVAGEIQGSLIPHTFPISDKYNMYAFSIPAKGVGGDYYDYIDFGNNKLAITMFDVSGKGVPAALIMVMIRSILRTIASLEEETNDVISKLNNTISGEIVEDRYATGFYLLFDAERGIMSYTNAGHGPLVLYRAAKDEFEYLDTDGMPVGIMSGIEYGKGYTTLEKGDIAVLYTDGITEAMNNDHEEYGMDRFYAMIRANKRAPSEEISNRILEDVNRFVSGAPQHDDETLLIFKMR